MISVTIFLNIHINKRRLECTQMTTSRYNSELYIEYHRYI